MILMIQQIKFAPFLFKQLIFYCSIQIMGETCSTCQTNLTTLEEVTIPEAPFNPHSEVDGMKQQPDRDKRQYEQSKKSEKKNEVSVLTSKFTQARNYQKFNSNAVKLQAMSDFTNQIVQEKKKNHGKFIYDRDQLEVQGAEFIGPLEFEKKYVYQGQWKNNERNGRGIQQWKDGSIYEGYWKDNVAFGYGRLIHADGDVYEGEWLDDRASGKGIYYSSCGAKYQGEWREDKQNGYGEETWPDEAVFKGQYKNGKKNGKGMFHWEDDSRYEGDFENNNIHGNGKYIWKDGRIYEGEWKNNKMQGKGVFTWPDGRRYEGQYVNDKKEGFGTFLFRDGRIYEGEWKNGKQHGKGLFKKKNVIRQGIWEDGERISWLDETKQNKTQSQVESQQDMKGKSLKKKKVQLKEGAELFGDHEQQKLIQKKE